MIMYHTLCGPEKAYNFENHFFQCYGFYVTISIISLGGNVESLSLRPSSLEAWAQWHSALKKDPRTILSWACRGLLGTVFSTTFVTVSMFSSQRLPSSAFPSSYGINISFLHPPPTTPPHIPLSFFNKIFDIGV